METLTVGDIRKKGDETRQVHIGDGRYRMLDPLRRPNPGPWKPVSLVGWPILPADLFNAEFRRP